MTSWKLAPRGDARAAGQTAPRLPPPVDVTSLLNLALLGLGFGFVIFWHELGHFLAAKWAGVRVEQFAVGFGNAIVSYRKGLGFRRGTSAPEYERLKESNPAAAGTVSPTEYRLNWLPLGGYVKMLGQEDLAVESDPNDPPREPDHYRAASVGKRMVIISAGVVMNVILAAVLFTIVYTIGFTAAAPRLGLVLPGGPADAAGLRVGDEVVSINGAPTHDFGKVRLGVALLAPDEAARFVVQRAGGEVESIEVTPAEGAGAAGMLGVGVAHSPRLRVPGEFDFVGGVERGRLLAGDDAFKVLPGEAVVEVDGRAVEPDEYHLLHDAFQRAGRDGRAARLVVAEAGGGTRIERVMPTLIAADGDRAFAGLRPLLQVSGIEPDAPAGPGGEREASGLDVLRPGDVIRRLIVPSTGDVVDRPSFERLVATLDAAGSAGRTVDLVVTRDGERVRLRDLPLMPLGGGFVTRLIGAVNYGLGAHLTPALSDPSLAAVASDDSPARRANAGDLLDVPGGGGRIVSVAGEPVDDWYDVGRLLREAAAEDAAPTTRPATVAVPVTIQIDGPAGSETRTLELALEPDDVAAVRAVAFGSPLALIQPGGPNEVESYRQTYNPLQAVWWGLFETRDQIANLYVTLRRVLFDRTVPASGLSGPVGILHFGSIVAQRGYDWLLWFLAMLSANLAVVNFLPIPILDGGHMVFLIWEKIRGRAPPRAVQEGALWGGLLFLLCFVVFVTFNDLSRLITL